jgi:hypothetical protein
MVKIVIGDQTQEVDSNEGGFGFEFLPIMLSYFQNCIAYGGDRFFTFEVEGETPFNLLVKSISTILQIDTNLGDSRESSISAMKMIGTLLENLHGKIDHIMPDIITVLHNELKAETDSKLFKSAIFQTFGMCFVYSTSLTYVTLANLGFTEYMLTNFFRSLDKLSKTYEMRRCLYGLS